MKLSLGVFVVVLLGAAVVEVQTPSAVVEKIKAAPGFQAASAFLDSDYDRFVTELVTLTEIPAPPFKETARGAAYLQMLKDAAGIP